MIRHLPAAIVASVLLLALAALAQDSTWDDRFGPGELKGLSQTGDSFPAGNFADSRFASAEHHQFRTSQIDAHDFEAG